MHASTAATAPRLASSRPHEASVAQRANARVAWPAGAAAVEEAVFAHNRAIDVVVRWGGRAIDVRRVSATKGAPTSLTIGRSADCDVYAPCDRAMLLCADGDGSFAVIAPLGATTAIVRDADGTSEQVVMPPHSRVRLGDDDVITVGIFDHRITLRVAARIRAPLVSAVFDALWANAALCATSVVVVALAAALLAPPTFDDIDVEFNEHRTHYQALILKPTPRDNAFLRRLEPGKRTEPKPKTAAAAAPKHTPAPRAAMAAKKAETNQDVVDAHMRSLFGLAGGVVSVFADDGGAALASAMQGLDGARTASAAGGDGRIDGTGARGVPGAGGLSLGTLSGGRITTRGRGDGSSYGEAVSGLTAKVDRDVSVVVGPTVVTGGLDPEVIRRIVREHQGQVRYCYEQALIRSPGLTGKVTMRFVINGQGYVTQAGAAEDQLHSPDVTACLKSRVQGWRFPEPKGGGIVVVTYPFVFKQG